MNLFQTKETLYNLDSSYEFTNRRRKEITKIKSYADEDNVKVFKLLQKMNRNVLVEPVEEKYMYYVAMHNHVN